MDPNLWPAHDGQTTKMRRKTLALILLALGWAILVAEFSWGSSHEPWASHAKVDAQSELRAGLAAFDALHYGPARKDFAALAKAGNPEGEMWLAYMDELGLGAPQNLNAAVAGYTKAADAGSAEAARRLGELYLRGRGVLQDVDRARKWIQQAASEGDTRAQRDLGEIYARGIGVPKAPAQAYAWLDIAASRGDRLAARERNELLTTLTPDAIDRAETLAQATMKSISQTESKPADAKGATSDLNACADSRQQPACVPSV